MSLTRRLAAGLSAAGVTAFAAVAFAGTPATAATADITGVGAQPAAIATPCTDGPRAKCSYGGGNAADDNAGDTNGGGANAAGGNAAGAKGYHGGATAADAGGRQGSPPRRGDRCRQRRGRQGSPRRGDRCRHAAGAKGYHGGAAADDNDSDVTGSDDSVGDAAGDAADDRGNSGYGGTSPPSSPSHLDADRQHRHRAAGRRQPHHGDRAEPTPGGGVSAASTLPLTGAPMGCHGGGRRPAGGRRRPRDLVHAAPAQRLIHFVRGPSGSPGGPRAFMA